MEGAEDFVAGNGIDPDIGAEHFAEDFGGWAGLHGEAGLEAFGGGEELDIGDALADDTGVIDPERGADFGGEGEEKVFGVVHWERVTVRLDWVKGGRVDEENCRWAAVD